jgi:hypothetical protein
MRQLAVTLLAISIGIAAGFWIAPPFGSFAVLAKPVAK